MKKFWNYIRNEDGERVLRLEGPIDEESFWGTEITPQAFREELEADEGDVTVWINSPGGSVFAAAEIYNMLCDHKGKVTVKIDAIAASAASVIAMAGDRVLMSPVSMFMIHDPMTIAMGNTKDMEKAISTLNEVKESIINAYQRKTGLSRNKISQLMENETWLNAKKAVELGFADEILFGKNNENEPKSDEKAAESEQTNEEKKDKSEPKNDNGEAENEKNDMADCWQPYSTKIMGQRVLNSLLSAEKVSASADEKSDDNDKTNAEKPEKPETEENSKTPQKDTLCTTETDENKVYTAQSEEIKDDTDDKNVKNDTDNINIMNTNNAPVIGMDGKTADGSMPYELLKKQLELLK